MNKFTNDTVLLKGSNLIEASAGTGKTYSIAILVLRLIIKKKIPIQKILLVTFTEAAAAELKERVTKFIRIAIKDIEATSELTAKEITIWKIVKDAVANGNKEDVLMDLNTALLNIDEAAISTIHSFCQKTLTEFAFETNQIFGGELLENLDDIIQEKVGEYWRNEIAGIDTDVQDIFPEKFFQVITDAVKKALSGQIFIGDLVEISKFKEIQEIMREIDHYFENKRKEFIKRVEAYKADGYGEATALKALNIIKECANYYLLFSSAPKFHLSKIFEQEIVYCNEQANKIKQIKRGIINTILLNAVKTIAKNIEGRLVRENYLTFDALIKNLHTVKDSDKLKSVLNEKYEAIFIDEFQDTDKLQYEIFEAVFQSNSNSVIFYIGDPKQSIYSFRKADLNTYFRAKENVSKNGKVWNMNVNYRSNGTYIEAMNKFFDAANGFDVFEDPNILYHNVEAYSKNKDKKGIVKNGNEHYKQMIIRKNYPNKDLIEVDLVNLVIHLLDGNHTVDGETIVPSDIGILVRKNYEGMNLKKELEKRGVPAVVVDGSSIFSSEEAKDIGLILNGILNPSSSNIDKALLTNLINKNSNELSEIDHDLVLILFKEYERIWVHAGIYAMFKKLLADFGIEDKWLSKEKINAGFRVLSNANQVIELLQKVATSRNFTPLKLSNFLQRAINEGEEQEDEFTQRIERDETAVKIATIHKSKGLEYKIVLLPNLDFDEEEKYSFSSFRDDNDNYYFTLKPISKDKHRDCFIKQLKQENRRLLYVAVTRARFNCFIFAKKKTKDQESGIVDPTAINLFIEKLERQKQNSDLINIIDAQNDRVKLAKYIEKININFNERAFPTNKPFDDNWHKLSYSFVAAAYKSHPTENNKQYEPSYDHFIFKELQKGTTAGDLLHNIFEHIDFTKNDEWEKVIDISLNKFARSKTETYKPWLPEMIRNVLNAPIKTHDKTFQLMEIDNENKINEFEFDFNVEKGFDIENLRDLFSIDDERAIYTGYGNVKGMFTGFIDMFFEYQGKYYILDWKSNFLGDDIGNYAPENLNDAMNDGNYHLQYLIYTLALKKYLQSKFSDFSYEKNFGGVIYVFLRGVRAGTSNGIYFTKPEESIICELEKKLN